MNTYDWIVIGNGIAGAALSYELAQQGHSVLLLERDATFDNATRWSYGGISHWSAKTLIMRQLCQEGFDRHCQLSEELGAPTHFRELDLLLTIGRQSDPERLTLEYAGCVNPPILLSARQACELEPLLNREAIAAALTAKHGHVDPVSTVKAYNQAFERLGGQIQLAQVEDFTKTGDRITGVQTSKGAQSADRVVVCAGGWSGALLKASGINRPVYYSHAELIETPPVEVQLQTLVMPAEMRRFQLEEQASDPQVRSRWEQSEQEVVPTILDAGVVQLIDGRLRIGQISRVHTALKPPVDPAQSEARLRQEIGEVLPALRSQPGTWHHCLVAFNPDGLPLAGPVPHQPGLYLFTGFSNPFAILPAVATRFAAWVNGQPDELIDQMLPNRLA